MSSSAGSARHTSRSVTRAVHKYIQAVAPHLAVPTTSASRSAAVDEGVRQTHSVDHALGLEGATMSTVIEIFTHLVQGRSWSSLASMDESAGSIPMELVCAKFDDRSLVLRVDGEPCVVFTPQSALLQARKATALQRVVLQHVVDLCGWSWARVTFERDGQLALLNTQCGGSSRVAYPLADALRIEVPAPLAALCATASELAHASRRALDRQRREARRASEAAAAAATSELGPLGALVGGSVASVSGSGGRVEKRRSGKTRRRRRTRRGFHRDQTVRQLHSTIQRNTLFCTHSDAADDTLDDDCGDDEQSDVATEHAPAPPAPALSRKALRRRSSIC
eukprot:TRINITY_DN1608_c0_g1_i4.p1 TRINITY_DN1608_c0_g1~~TRINITY_DN1608_c0_g1_i4.p1  ORF type:complete len:337 (-),score=173.32 TRINITY_DN1608_c0_g1_i4:303-1313(-)